MRDDAELPSPDQPVIAGAARGVTRAPGARITPNVARVIARPFLPGGAPSLDGRSRVAVALARIVALSEDEVERTLSATWSAFESRHRDLDAVLERSVDALAQQTPVPDGLSPARRRLIGAFFTHEYAIEAAALTNPSIVAAPDQSGLAPGELRFVMSLRAIGEGHLSCIELRSGVLAADRSVRLDPPSRYAGTGRRSGAEYDRAHFHMRVQELGVDGPLAEALLGSVGPRFVIEELDAEMAAVDTERFDRYRVAEAAHMLRWLATSSYRVDFAETTDISERVIFPVGPAESNGMEDVRLVRFLHDDGRVVYYGTYTAFDGHQILPQLIETTDFVSFRVMTLGGASARNKGIALFPRKVRGRFLALGRHDNVNNFLMASDDVRVWTESARIQEPKLPWELMQLGNCGSPLETEHGWLVITHGVGPMRQYSLGALLLDLEDPTRVLGHLREPLLEAIDDERDGYVPNVVYSCGSLLHDGQVVIPYGVSDRGARIATVRVDDLLARLA